MRDWVVQLRKGLLEFCLLNLLSDGERYGYQLVHELKGVPELSIGEGTAYPILNRLRRDGFVRMRQAASESGPPRRYYSLTDLGERRIKTMNDYWDDLVAAVGGLRTPAQEDEG